MSLVRSKTNRDGFQGSFDDLFALEFPALERGSVQPNTSLSKVNIKENEKEFSLELAAPGLAKSDFKIQLEQNLLTVSSEKKEESLKEDQRYSKKEFSYQPFRNRKQGGKAEPGVHGFFVPAVQ
jgi:HSP20 family protein